MNITDALLTKSEYNRPGTALNPTKLAIHYTGNPGSTAINNRNFFENLRITKKKKASSHWIVGLVGEILRLIPENEKCYCTNAANAYALAIETCHPDASGKFNDATYLSLVELSADICKRHGFDPQKDIIRHYDVTGKKCPKYFVDHPDAWQTFKNDVQKKMNGGAVTSRPAEKPQSTKLDVDGFWGSATTKATQKFLGTYADGIVSRQPAQNQKYLKRAVATSWKFLKNDYGTGSPMIRALQKLIGASQDGFFGKKSVTALQNFLNRKGYGVGAADGYMGEKTVKGWQIFLNDK